jgi:hypothetical protein
MATPSKVEVPKVSASVSVAGTEGAAQPQQITAERIASAVIAWIDDPQSAAKWGALALLSQQSGTVMVTKEDGSQQGLPVYDAVSQEFWSQYARLPFEKREKVVSASVALIGPSTCTLHREILATIIAREPEQVKAAAQKALEAIPEDEISSGRRDREMVKVCYEGLALSQDEACAKKDAPKDCAKRSEDLHRQFRRYSDHTSIGIGLGARAAWRFAGEPVREQSLGVEIVADRVDGNFTPGLRLLYGGRFFMGSGMMSISGRMGGHATLGESTSLKLALEGGYLRATGENDEADDVAISPDGVVTIDGHRVERMRIQPVDRTLNAASLMVAADFEHSILGSREGRGDPFQLNLYIGLGAGIFAGGVADDGCAYAYTPGTAGVTVLPGGESVAVSPSAELGSRCNRGSFSMGTDLRGAVGLRSVF